MSVIGAKPFAQITPCIDPGVHRFTVAFPPPGTFGRAVVVCERCGLVREGKP